MTAGSAKVCIVCEMKSSLDIQRLVYMTNAYSICWIPAVYESIIVFVFLLLIIERQKNCNTLKNFFINCLTDLSNNLLKRTGAQVHS